MSERTSKLTEEDLSDLIGEIYDCVLDPARWETTLDRLRGLLNCANCSLAIHDVRQNLIRARYIVGIDPYWIGRIQEFTVDAMELMLAVPDLMSRPLDDPFVGRRDVSDEVWRSNRYYQEWGVPQGIVDIIALHMMRGPGHFAELGLGRHKSHGFITEREVRLMRLLAPHLRRAVTISNIIDMKSIEVQALGNALDLVPAAVVLVAENAEILHTNLLASRMIEKGSPIRSAGGRLSVCNSETAARLRQVISSAVRNESQIGDAGIGMALLGNDGHHATANVLPIAAGELRTRLVPNGAAAVFVASDENQPAFNLQPVAEAFGLSQAETRVLQRVMLGETLAEAALALGVSQNTVRTHISRIFSKTQTQRQASLIALVQRLIPPAVPPGDT